MVDKLATIEGPTTGLAALMSPELRKGAAVLADSGLVPKQYAGKPADVLVAVIMGAEVGLPPTQALQSIAVINGRPSLWGDGMLAVCQASPDFEDIEEIQTDDKATCAVKRKGRSPVVRSFSMADAKKAGLAGKSGPWSQYPKRMMQMRARAFALRDAFSDALKGLGCAEEARDINNAKPVAARVGGVEALKQRANIAEPEIIDADGAQVDDTPHIIQRIATATDTATLLALVPECEALTGDELEEARAAFADKREELKEREG